MTRRTATLLAALALAAGGLTGCGLRIAAPDPKPAEPAAAELVRQREALRASVYADTLRRGDPADSRTLAPVAAHAARQLEALGGVWEAWPQGDGPAGTPLPKPSPDITLSPTPRALYTSLAATTPELCSQVAGAASKSESVLYASICVSRTADLARLARTLHEKGPAAPKFPRTVRSDSRELARALDAAAYATEIHAAKAHAAGDQAWVKLGDRAAELRRLGAEIARINGWLATENDPRAPYYTVTGLPDQRAVAAALSRAFVAAIGNSSNRQALLDAALYFALESGGDLGALPGIE